MKVGVFTLASLILIGVTTVLVNDKPYWYRPCQLVHINVEDATGLKMKSPVRSLGLEIGYLSTVELSETHVTLGICITAPVEVLPATRAYIRGEGFLGDKFVELKPVRYVGGGATSTPSPASSRIENVWRKLSAIFESDAHAQDTTPTPAAADPAPSPTPSSAAKPRGKGSKGDREIPVGESNQDVQALVGRVDELVGQMTSLTNNLRQAINPEELRDTMRQLNRTLENASRTLSPDSGLNQTAQRTLAKLEDAVEQLRDMMTRINKGEGSIGKLVNDPSYAEEIHKAIQNINKLLTKVGDVRFVVDVGVERLTVYDGSRAWFELGIWPTPSRYYLLGIAFDPRGSLTQQSVTTTTGGQTVTTQTTTTDQTGILFTAMLGKVFFNRVDLSAGALYGDGTGSAAFWLGPEGMENRIIARFDLYSRGAVLPLSGRITATLKPWMGTYVTGGIESIRTVDGVMPWLFGVGLSFDDEDIKLLFALK